MTAPESKSDKSFWTTLPGILTGIAAVLTAIATLIGALSAAGIISFQSPTPPPSITASPSISASPFTFTFTPNPAKRGTDVEIRPSVAMENAVVYFNGQALPKKVQANGRSLIVTVPANAESGYFELANLGIRIRAADKLNILP